VLHDLGFTKCKSEHGLYTRVKNRVRLIVEVYVDDLVILLECDKEVNQLKGKMKQMFWMSDLSPFVLSGN
jgi:hypothetical protein